MASFKIIRSGNQDDRDRQFDQIIGQSAALEAVLENVERVASTTSTVLIQGETGTGKELIAKAVHNISPRYDRPFVKVNCAAIPLDLLESELFGHERGAFTGAISQKIGRFELADKGTLFLDEIGDIPLALQPKLLRVLQEQEFERLGSSRTHRVDVRVVAATHRDLEEMVKQGEFCGDLYYRLNVFPCSCRLCGRAVKIYLLWSGISSTSIAGRSASGLNIFPKKRCRRCARTPGPATCGNCRT